MGSVNTSYRYQTDYIISLYEEMSLLKRLVEEQLGQSFLNHQQMILLYAHRLLMSDFREETDLKTHLMGHLKIDQVNEIAERIHDQMVFTLRPILSSTHGDLKVSAIERHGYSDVKISIVDMEYTAALVKEMEDRRLNPYGE